MEIESSSNHHLLTEIRILKETIVVLRNELDTLKVSSTNHTQHSVQLVKEETSLLKQQISALREKMYIFSLRAEICCLRRLVSSLTNCTECCV